MTDNTSSRVVRVGTQATANIFHSEPTYTGYIEPSSEIDLSGLTQEKLTTSYAQGDNEMDPVITGVRGGTIPLSFTLRGLGQNDGTTPVATDLDLHDLFQNAFGAVYAGADGSSASTVTAQSESTPSIDVVDGTDFVAGDPVLFDPTTASPDRDVARIVKSVSSNTLTLSAGGWVGTDTGETVYSGLSYGLDVDIHNPAHVGLEIDGDFDNHVIPSACVESCTITFPGNGGPVRVDFVLRVSDFQTAATQSLAFSAQTTGNEVQTLDGEFKINEQSYWQAGDLTLTITNTLAPRNGPAGSSGLSGFAGADGFVVTRREATFSGTFLAGGNFIDGDADTTHEVGERGDIPYAATGDLIGYDTLLGDTPQTLHYQAGKAEKSACLVYIDQANFTSVSRVSVDGQEAISFTAKAGRSATSGMHSCYFAIF